MIKKYILLLLIITLSPVAFAAPSGTIEQGKYLVHYSVFNSKFIPADIAKLHQLPREKNVALINISVHLKDSNQSVSASVNGTVKNLIQQQSKLVFKEIKEQNHQYYLARIKHTNEEVMHFKISVSPNADSIEIPIKFSQKLHSE